MPPPPKGDAEHTAPTSNRRLWTEMALCTLLAALFLALLLQFMACRAMSPNSPSAYVHTQDRPTCNSPTCLLPTHAQSTQYTAAGNVAASTTGSHKSIKWTKHQHYLSQPQGKSMHSLTTAAQQGRQRCCCTPAPCLHHLVKPPTGLQHAPSQDHSMTRIVHHVCSRLPGSSWCS